MSALTALSQHLEKQATLSRIPQPAIPQGGAPQQPPAAKVPAAPAPSASPVVPNTLEETGLTGSTVEQLILKILYFRGELLGRELAVAMGLKFSIIDHIVENFKRQHLVAVKRSSGMGNMSAVLVLTEAGRSLAREYMENNSYAGPAPVPLEQYVRMVRVQKPKQDWLSSAQLQQAFSGLVVSPALLAQIGPALNASKSFLIYGQPGNGKTALAEALNYVETEPIFIPYAIEYQGNIVQMYDPIYHQRIEEATSLLSAVSTEMSYDCRWFRCKRPFIITGGELSLDMLDLCLNNASKVYDAPFQLKANNGIYLIDDFGRQKASPAEVLNRWIVPMERHIDYLSFQSGGKMTVPFECFLIFSTNLKPHQLGDEAFLRRIQYKMLLRSPDRAEFIQIFQRYCAARGLQCPPELLDTMIDKYWQARKRPFRRCHPRDVISHAIDILHFERKPLLLDEDVLCRAYESCFVDDSVTED
ncbi:MAG: hypothetical protein K2X35_09910 [Bryobacteraceae bacterium]|nr:hypothetical protein [Bryobacteraceae bacterium]